MQFTLKHPVIYLDAGWQTLVEGLRRAAEQAGARIVSNTRVEAVEHRNGRVLKGELARPVEQKLEVLEV